MFGLLLKKADKKPVLNLFNYSFNHLFLLIICR